MVSLLDASQGWELENTTVLWLFSPEEIKLPDTQTLSFLVMQY